MIGACCILLVTWLVTVATFVGIFFLRSWRIHRQKMRMPVTEKLLRGPGEGLRKKLDELDDKISEELAAAYVLPLLCTSIVFLQLNAPQLGPRTVGAAVVGVPAFIFLCRRLWRLLDQRRNYRLGLSGERAVGEELNQLMLAGCRVFHDVPNDPYGNVDHVLVAPSGVYAVETKGRRKREADGKERHKVAFDGRSLRFGAGPPEYKCLEQAKQQASRLSDWLSKAVGEAIPVHPVLALPGWWVDRRGCGEVIVLSGKAVDSLAKGRAILDASKIARVAQQLDQRCRDVEF
jgi:hypothetical protein